MQKSATQTLALQAGLSLREAILKNGLNPGAIVQIRRIFENHPDEKAGAFVEGLMGLSGSDKAGRES